MRQRVERALAYKPDIQAHREELTEDLNDALREVVGMRRWRFRYRRARIRAMADLTIAEADWSIATDERVSFVLPSTWTAQEYMSLPGHRVEIDGSQYVIENITFSLGLLTLYLDPNWVDEGYFAAGKPAGDLVIRFERYRLPFDVDEVVSLAERTSNRKQPLREVSNPREAELVLSEDETGTPTHYLLDNHRPLDRWWPSPMPRYEHPELTLESPHEVPTAAESAGGSLSLLETYSYCIAWSFSGMVSEPGPVVEITLTGSNRTVDLSGLDTYGDVNYGRRRKVFRRRGEGPWYQIAEIVDPTQSTYTDDGTEPAHVPGAEPGYGDDPNQEVRMRQLLAGGFQQWIRLWPKPDADTELTLVYLSRPPLLEHDTDTPQVPPEIAKAAVHRVVMQRAGEADAPSLAALHQNLYEEQLSIAANRGVEGGDTRHVRALAVGKGNDRYEPLVGTLSWEGDL